MGKSSECSCLRNVPLVRCLVWFCLDGQSRRNSSSHTKFFSQLHTVYVQAYDCIHVHTNTQHCPCKASGKSLESRIFVWLYVVFFFFCGTGSLGSPMRKQAPLLIRPWPTASVRVCAWEIHSVCGGCIQCLRAERNNETKATGSPSIMYSSHTLTVHCVYL